MIACASPLPDETLSELFAGQLPEVEAAAADEHLFSCDACEARARRLATLLEGLRELIPPVLSAAHLARLTARGMRILVNPVQPGVDSEAFFGDDLDLLVHALHADFSAVEQVDLELLIPGAPAPAMRLEGAPIDREQGRVLIACQRHFRALFPDDTRFRLVGRGAQEPRVLGEYFVLHHWP